MSMKSTRSELSYMIARLSALESENLLTDLHIAHLIGFCGIHLEEVLKRVEAEIRKGTN